MTLFDPRLISSTPFIPHAYSDLVAEHAISPELITLPRYENSIARYQALTDVTVEQIQYQSGELQVSGIMAAPTQLQPKKHPLLIFNRGGHGEFGKLFMGLILRHIVPFAQAGYLVFASNYRGSNGAGGLDEMGGSDLQDVMTLLDIAKRHPGWDGINIFMLGFSRGGTMTYQAIRAGAKPNAAATIAAPSDLWAMAQERPSMESNVYVRRIPDFIRNRELAYLERSAVRWPEQLNVPLLLLHGDADTQVEMSHTIALDKALTQARQPHKTILYPSDDHYLSKHAKESVQEIKAWFALYRK